MIYILAFPKVAGKVARGDSRVTIEDCCLIFRRSFLIRMKVKLLKLQSSSVSLRSPASPPLGEAKGVISVLLSPMWWRFLQVYFILSPSPKLRRGCHVVTGEDCCLIFRKGFFNKDDINYKISILFSLATLDSFPASWGSQVLWYMFARKFPPLGEAKVLCICLQESFRLLGKPSVVVYVCEKVAPLGEAKVLCICLRESFRLLGNN